MITERLMKPGQWSVRFKSGAAWWARQADYCDHIVVTADRLQPIGGFADATIKAAALYTGVVLDRSAREMSGEGLAWWLGTDDGRGDLLDTAVTQSAATLSTWITALLPASITAGTVTNTGTSLTARLQWTSRREAIDYVCRSVGAEWTISPAGVLSAAAPATLHAAYTTPVAVITRHNQSSEGSLEGIDAADLRLGGTLGGYSTKVIVVGKTGDGAQVATGSATNSTSYKDLHGNTVVLERLVNAPTAPATDVGTLATNTANLFSAARTSVKLTSDVYAATSRVAPGDNVWVYDLDENIVDTANQILWRGGVLSPAKLRCKSITWGIQSGMGVYVRSKTGTYTDITDQIIFDTQPGEWEVGTSTADLDGDPQQLGTAYLGTNPAIVDRTTAAATITWTPTTTNVTGGAVSGWGVRTGNVFTFSIRVTAGTATAAAVVTFTLPTGFTAISGLNQLCHGFTNTVVLAYATNGAATATITASAAGAAFGAGASVVSTVTGTVILA
jgi:hypothetical protein